MSWDSFIDTLKSYSQNGAIGEGVILGKDNGALWTSPTEHLTALDDKALKQIVGKSSDALVHNGVRFMFLRPIDEDDGTYQLLYKKKEVGSLCVYVTNQTIIIALVPEDKSVHAGEVTNATKCFANYLVGQGY